MIGDAAQLPNPPRLPGGAARQLGMLLANSSDGLAAVADIARYEYQHDPDGQGPDSDPYATVSWCGCSNARASTGRAAHRRSPPPCLRLAPISAECVAA
jgi:hypothetical protein